MVKYRIVEYKGANYCVFCYVKKDGTERLFITDEDDLQIVLSAKNEWHELNGYVGYSTRTISGRLMYYLHELIMNKANNGDDSKKQIIDYITGITHDNRKDNLQLITQSMQNENQQNRKKTCVFPKNCGFTVDDIPKCCYYYGPTSDGHGEKFEIELRHNGETYKWDTSSANDISLVDKLAECIKILISINTEYPELLENKNIIENYSDKQLQLMRDFNNIIQLSAYVCVNDNLLKIPKKKFISYEDLPGLTPETKKKYLDSTNTAKKSRRLHKSNLPKGCGITPDMIPAHCYFQKESKREGSHFTIDGHPDLPTGKRDVCTSASKKVSVERKFKELFWLLDGLREAKETGTVFNKKDCIAKREAEENTAKKTSMSKKSASKKPVAKETKKKISGSKTSKSQARSSGKKKQTVVRKSKSGSKTNRPVSKKAPKKTPVPKKPIDSGSELESENNSKATGSATKAPSGSKTNKPVVKPSGSKTSKSSTKSLLGSKTSKSSTKSPSGSKTSKSDTKLSSKTSKSDAKPSKSSEPVTKHNSSGSYKVYTINGRKVTEI